MRTLARALPVLVLVAVAAVAAGVKGGFKDLLVYQHAGRAFLDGAPVYGSDEPVNGLPFTYPPFAAVVMAPLAWLPASLAAALWTAASVAALVAVVVVVLTTLGRPAAPWMVALVALGALALEPVWQDLTFGQVSLVLMLAVLVDLLRPERRWSGVLVGLAAGVKLVPLVLVVLLVLVGRPRAAGRASLAFAATVVVGFVAMPGAAATYWTDDLLRASRVGPPELATNQSVYGALTRLLHEPPPTWLWLAVAGPLALAVLLVGAAWWRRGDRLLGTCLGAMAMLLASPISWSHHWVWALPVALLLWERSRPVAVAWTAVFVTRPILWPPWGEHRELDWGALDHVLGNAYLIAGLALAAWAAVALRTPTSLSRPDREATTGSGDGGSSRQHDRLARAVVTAGQVGVQLVAAPWARDAVRQVHVVGLDGVPHLRASFLVAGRVRTRALTAPGDTSHRRSWFAADPPDPAGHAVARSWGDH